jgi:hypothetical protein
VDEFVLLASPIDGAQWDCPAGAVDAWVLRGWLPCSAPSAPAVESPPAQPAKSSRTSKKDEE